MRMWCTRGGRPRTRPTPESARKSCESSAMRAARAASCSRWPSTGKLRIAAAVQGERSSTDESAKDGGKVRRQGAAAALAAAAAAVAEAAMSGRGVRGARGEGEGKVQSVYVERAHSSTIRSSSTPAATVPLRPSVGADALKPTTVDVDICTIGDGCRLSAASRRWRSNTRLPSSETFGRRARSGPKLTPYTLVSGPKF